VNARWGNIVAVMGGDMLLTVALGRLEELDRRITTLAVSTVAEMARAAIAEVEARGDLSLPLEQLRQIAEGKTGALFGWCGAGAALAAGEPKAVDRFEAFGRRLGVAFQIADDVRDLTGTDKGKPQYADVQSRTPSLPILLAAAKDDSIKKRLKESWAFTAMTPDRVRELGSAVVGSGAVQLAIEKVDAEINAAIDVLGPYAAVPGGHQLVAWAKKLAEGLQARE
jgi:octaprenyl-diphosphate synthase